ncbi:MAG: hypothetical protein GX051_09895 [Clostridiales bacterium]|nr:hypothetical protein [Clostridiales bacterium]
MKKILCILLVTAMLLSLAACGGDKGDTTTTTTAETTTEAPVAQTTAEPQKVDGNLVASLKDGVLVDSNGTAITSVADGQKFVAADGKTVAEVKGDKVVDANGKKIFTVKDGKLLGADGAEITTEPTTAAQGGNDTPSQGGNDTTTTTKANTSTKPEGKAAIVEYFNAASNKIKTEAKSVTHHYSKISLNGATTLPKWANTALKLKGGADKFINDQLTKNSKGEQVYTGSAEIKAKYPVENESYSSKLTAADVSSATCTEANGVYTIKIVTIADEKSSTVQHGQGHAPKAFSVVLPGVVNENVSGVAKSFLGGDAEMNYPASTIVVTVDVATGRITKATYDLKWTINFGTDVIIPFTTDDSFTINW